MVGVTCILAIALTILPTVINAGFIIQDGQLTITRHEGSTTVKFSETGVVEKVNLEKVPINSTDSFKVNFKLLESLTNVESEAVPVVPRQASILAIGLDSDRTYVLGSVKIKKSNGHAHWELDMTRSPKAFLNLSPTGSVSIDLLIAGSDKESDPIRIKLCSLLLHPSIILPFPYWNTDNGKAPASLEMEKYSVQPELHWTFQPPQKPVHSMVSGVFTVISLIPWLGLFAAYHQISSQNRHLGFSLLLSAPPSLTPTTIFFIISLLTHQALIIAYWIGLKLYVYLPLAGIGSIPLILSGRSALRQLKRVRRERPIVMPRGVVVKGSSSVIVKPSGGSTR